MKQFNLEEYLKNPSKKVVTRNGKEVKIHCTNFTGTQRIIAQVEGSDCSVSFDENGRYYIGNYDSQYDLFFAPEKHERWANVYQNSRGDVYFGQVHFSEEEAKDVIAPLDTYIKTIKVEWEE